ncbi:LLM class flavin-dependent oxidoreductase [Roseomonas sp. M0104]|uniref:LLM class flavin-dependent oxidoreductase n=1 Tax=Teichococcus coralli TaxID=2545983 RepID=A0A845BAI0_9PROT|nr:LLM class flavin-dependent oxidoreductase [Pseudoroseomonas coralli]MXP63094.1 LLM class flavin-dependent oxidoreductase [Pseudoroseomonas coralli]
MLSFDGAIEIFTTCPQSRTMAAAEYLRAAREAAAWSDEAGCTGMLIYTDNGIVDPWLVAQAMLQSTRQLSPLVAVQPIYMHPYSAAKMVSSLAFLHGRRIHLNMLAGGFRNDLAALGDTTPHDQRYVRTIEYALVLRRLLEAEASVTFQGQYYEVQNLRMTPPLPAELFPGLLISGSSEAGQQAAAAIGATAVEYPKPPLEARAAESLGITGRTPRGIRVGIIARNDPEEAWRIAFQRFPEDRRGRLAHQLAMKTSDSLWHRQLSELAKRKADQRDTYWLWPFENYGTFCPYLVGEYETVSNEIATYLRSGATCFILDIPREATDLETTGIVFRKALQKAGRGAEGTTLPAA